MKLKINPIFIFILMFSYVVGEIKTLGLFFSILCLHDFAHYLVAKYFDVCIESVEIMPFGCEMKIDDGYIDDGQKFFIYLAGPITNIFLAFLLYLLKFFGIYYFPEYNEILFANLCIGFINLLPFHPLDGSILLRILLSKVIGNLKASKVIIIMTQLFSTFLIVITVYSLLHGIYNISYGIVGMFLLFQSIKEKSYIIMRAMQSEINKRKGVYASNKYLKSERICVPINGKLKKIMGYFNSNRYYIIEVVDCDNRYVATLTEEDVIEGIINLGYDCTIKDILI